MAAGTTVPFVLIILYMVYSLINYGNAYNSIVSNLTVANSYNLTFKEQMDESLQALDAVKTATDAPALPAPLEGWETELSFASGYVLKAEFADEKLTLSPSPEPVMGANPFTSGNAAAPEAPEAPPVTFALKAVETDEKRFLFHLPETGETVLFNARRFLFYALLRGRVVTGFAEIPPR